MRSLKILFPFLFILNVWHGYGQVKICDVNLEKIKYKKVREYLNTQQSHNIQSISDIKPSMQADSDNKGYHRDERIFVIKDSLAKVWKHYLHTNPSESWNANRVSFGLLFSKKEDKIIYQGEQVSSLDTGQVIYLNLKLFKGITNLATVFEFISIDDINNMIEFSYVDGNVTKGKQQIFFKETEKGYTEIIHATYFKSSSFIRDRFYPYFHGRMIGDFHRNMKKLFNLKRQTDSNIPEELSTPILVSYEKESIVIPTNF